MKAAVFVRRNGAEGAGHVGWAFEYQDHSFNAGSVENMSGSPVSPPGKTDFWSQRVSDPVLPMIPRGYNEFKTIEVGAASTDRADATVAWVGKEPYLGLGRNCMDDTYDVLRSYGVPHLPVPALHWAPNFWYDSIVGDSQPIGASGVSTAQLTVSAPPAAAGESAGTTAAVPPPWRVNGTPEWLEFELAKHRAEGIETAGGAAGPALAERPLTAPVPVPAPGAVLNYAQFGQAFIATAITPGVIQSRVDATPRNLPQKNLIQSGFAVHAKIQLDRSKVTGTADSGLHLAQPLHLFLTIDVPGSAHFDITATVNARLSVSLHPPLIISIDIPAVRPADVALTMNADIMGSIVKLLDPSIGDTLKKQIADGFTEAVRAASTTVDVGKMIQAAVGG